MLIAVVLLPAVAGLLSFLVRPDLWRRRLLVLIAAAHFAIVATCWVDRPEAMFGG